MRWLAVALALLPLAATAQPVTQPTLQCQLSKGAVRDAPVSSGLSDVIASWFEIAGQGDCNVLFDGQAPVPHSIYTQIGAGQPTSDSPVFGPSEMALHVAVRGCNRIQAGYCSARCQVDTGTCINDPARSCTTNAQCAPATCQPTAPLDPATCTTDDDCTGYGECKAPDPDTGVAESIYLLSRWDIELGTRYALVWERFHFTGDNRLRAFTPCTPTTTCSSRARLDQWNLWVGCGSLKQVTLHRYVFPQRSLEYDTQAAGGAPCDPDVVGAAFEPNSCQTVLVGPFDAANNPRQCFVAIQVDSASLQHFEGWDSSSGYFLHLRVVADRPGVPGE